MGIFIAVVAAGFATVTLALVFRASTDIPAWAYALAATVSSRMP